MATISSDRQGPTELSERNRRLIDHILGDGAHKGFADLAAIIETFMEAARADAANPPQEERSDPLDLAAADDNRPADLAAADAAVARIMAMSDEEIMAEPGAAERAVETGKVIAHAVALHDIRTVRDKLQAAFDRPARLHDLPGSAGRKAEAQPRPGAGGTGVRQSSCPDCARLQLWGSADLCRLHRLPENMEEVLWQQARRAGLKPIQAKARAHD